MTRRSGLFLSHNSAKYGRIAQIQVLSSFSQQPASIDKLLVVKAKVKVDTEIKVRSYLSGHG